MSSETDKKPVFKQIWFWVVIVIVAIGVCVVVGGKDDGPQKIGDASTNSGGSSEQASNTNSGSSSDANTPFAVGDIISLDGQEVSVVSVERAYDTGNQFVTASDGNEYVKVNLQIKNNSDETKSFNAFDWKMEDSNGVIDTYEIIAQADDALNSGDLASGGTKKGSLVFEVPAGDAGLKLHYKPNMFSSKEVIVNLQ